MGRTAKRAMRLWPGVRSFKHGLFAQLAIRRLLALGILDCCMATCRMDYWVLGASNGPSSTGHLRRRRWLRDLLCSRLLTANKGA